MMITHQIQATHKEPTGYYVTVLFTDTETGFQLQKNFRFDSEKQIESELDARIERGIQNTIDAIPVEEKPITKTDGAKWEILDGKIICYEKDGVTEALSVDMKESKITESAVGEVK